MFRDNYLFLYRFPEGSQVANQHLINTKCNPIPFPFISTAIFCLSEMEIVDLSKLSLCLVISTSTGLNEAKKEEFMLSPPYFPQKRAPKKRSLCSTTTPLLSYVLTSS